MYLVKLGESKLKIIFIICYLLSGFVWAQEPGADPQVTPDISTGGGLVDVRTFDKRDVDKMLEPFRYDKSAKRDPFRLPEGKAPLVPRGFFGPFLMTQEVVLDTVQLKGVFIHPKNPKVLVKLRGNRVVTMGLKDYIGENFGYIAAIKPGKVIIVQTKEQNGQRYSTTRTLSIEK